MSPRPPSSTRTYTLFPYTTRFRSPSERLLWEVERASAHCEPAKDLHWAHRAVIGEHDHMFAVIGDGIGARRVDHDRAVMPHLLLSARMAVIPVGAALPNRELIDDGDRKSTRLNSSH